MAVRTVDISGRVAETLASISAFSPQERLLLARLLLDSVLEEESLADQQWTALGLAAFTADWDNPDDAIYDNWREHYDIPEG